MIYLSSFILVEVNGLETPRIGKKICEQLVLTDQFIFIIKGVERGKMNGLNRLIWNVVGFSIQLAENSNGKCGIFLL